jgi:hypothetical protein
MRGSGQTREQIDGMVLVGGRAFLIESKFWTDKVDFGPIALFHTLLESRPTGTLGLFFSAFGYTYPALESAELLRPVRVLLIDQEDLAWVLGKGSFKGRMGELVRRKWLAAVKLGPSFVAADQGIELFN